jgi:hypothetical protein
MSDFVAGSRLRLLAFSISLIPGEGRVQTAFVTYEVVTPGTMRVFGPFTRELDLTLVQDAVNAAAQVIVGQILQAEDLQLLWPGRGWSDSRGRAPLLASFERDVRGRMAMTG